MNKWSKITIGDVAEIKHGWAFPGSGITEHPSENVLVTPGSFKIGGGFKRTIRNFLMDATLTSTCLLLMI